MRKMIAVILLGILLAQLLAGCGEETGTCHVCGKTDIPVSCIAIDGQDGWFCDACYGTVKALADQAAALN